MQFQESGPDQNIALVCEWLGADPAEDYEFFDAEYEAGLPGGGTIYYGNENEQAFPGQWIVRQGDKVWVQDEEPARVERWETQTRPLADSERCKFTLPGYGTRCPMELGHGGVVHNYSQHPSKVSHRRPVLSNGWTGPWEVVE